MTCAACGAENRADARLLRGLRSRADDHARRDAEQADDRTYEPPEVEPIGSVEELAKGNEPSQTDAGPG